MEPIHFCDTSIPDTMAPLDCLGILPDVELGLGTLGTTLKFRWAPFAEKGEMEISTAFWPSKELIDALTDCSEAFAVTAPDGMLLARRDGEGAPAVFEMDAHSLILKYPWDLLKVNEEALSLLTESRIEGRVREHAVLDGLVLLGEGSEILPGVYVEGVSVIGKNCKIGPNCYLRGCNFIGSKCHIGQAVEIKNSILMHHVSAGHLTYLGDSIVSPDVNFGGGTIASNFRHDGMNHRSMVKNTLIDTGRRKFGTVIGLNVHTGIHTSIYPGRKIWANRSTRPGEIVQRDLKSEGI